MKNWERGKPAPSPAHDARRTPSARFGDFRGGVYMRTLLRDPGRPDALDDLLRVPRPARRDDRLEIDHQVPEERGSSCTAARTRRTRSSATPPASCSSPACCGRSCVATCRRPYRIRIKRKPEHVVILATFLVIGVSASAARCSASPADGRWREHGLRAVELRRVAAQHARRRVVGVVARQVALEPAGRPLASFVVFFAILLLTMLGTCSRRAEHVPARREARSKGAMKPTPNLAETELETFGASVVEDFTWKQLLDTDVARCVGRTACARRRDGKPLTRGRSCSRWARCWRRRAVWSLSAGRHRPRDHVGANSLFERITSEELWAWTSCRACDESVRSTFETGDKILDMRRYLSLMESNFSPSWATPSGAWRTRATRGA